jgi:hypothetical protein
MIRAILFTICFCTTVSANDIYVTQTATDTVQSEGKPAFKEPIKSDNFEKDLLQPAGDAQYCSVIAGCQ